MSALRQVNLSTRHPKLTELDDSSTLLTVDETLDNYPNSIIERLKTWAEETPEHIFIARREKNNGHWIELSYAEAWNRIQKIASSLLSRDLSPDRPIAILSGNSIEHALMGLAAMAVGVPYAPISPQYSLVSTDYSKLKYVLDLITPGMVFVDNATPYAPAIEACVKADCEIVACDNTIPNRAITLLKDLEQTPVSDQLETVMAKVQPDTIAKFLFSSGSTGMPKAVVNTQRMICANQQMIVQTLPFIADPKPVLVDWLPWNHTFGGNHNVGLVIYNGGTLYIDEGKPAPKAFSATVKNLKEIAPTIYFNVPKGYEELVKALRRDKQLCEMFFGQVQMLFYAGAGISQPVWDALEELALDTCGERILIVTGLGCTETAPSSLFTTGDGGFAGWIGLPVPGCQAKLVNVGGKTEIRIQGDHVSPGYWREPQLTAKAFDEDGFYCTGDAIKFTDPNDLGRGLIFDGRISEDFKLDTGTWVSAGPLRVAFLNHFGGCVKDIVVAGRDKAFVSALVFPDFDVCRNLDQVLMDLSDKALCDHKLIIEYFRHKLLTFAEQATGSASRIRAIKLLVEPPSLDKNEITDKGSLNASAIQDLRTKDLESIYNGSDAEGIIIVG